MRFHQYGTLQTDIIRRGGPYTKSQQEKRRKEVYRLHFELGHSAIEIAEMMKTNRNTINSDIKILYSQVAEELQADNIGVLILKQIQRLEKQRVRLLADLEKEHSFHERLAVERLLFDVDNRISQIITKIQNGPYRFPQITHDELEKKSKDKPSRKEIMDITEKLLKHALGIDLKHVTTGEIQSEIIRITKCDVQRARDLVAEMSSYGLELCVLGNGFTTRGVEYEYDFVKFAGMYSL